MTHLIRQIRTAVLPAAATAAVAVALAGAGGCTSDQPGVPAEQFREPGEVTEVSRLADLQIAAGARTDATLRPYHFNHAGGLNSLGRTKLDNMLDADETDGAGELVVYVDVPTAAEADEPAKKLADARHDAVTRHLMSRGMSDGQFRLESGYNPNSLTFVVSATPQGDGAAAAAPPTAGDAGYGGGLQMK